MGMSKRIGIVAGLALAGVVVSLLWRASGPREPVFEGRPLTSWLDHHVASSAASPPYGSPGWKKADEAIRHIGTNAIPKLLEMIRAKDRPPLVLKLMDRVRRFGFPVMNYRYATVRHEEAEYAFGMLGTNAVSAVPELIRIYQQNISASSQMCAALALGHIGQGAQPALPALIQRFTHTNSDTRFYAVSAVTSIGGEPAVVVPALTSALKDPNVHVRWNALSGLSGFGGRARPAIPEILKMLDDPGMVGSDSITHQVQTALWRIAPEKVGKPLVVEEATPMITNGVTAQALKVIINGKRRSVIPLGRAVPAVAQFWNSDPRPRLTLYRGPSASEDADRFLGDFEVLDLPASDNLNVSTLFVVADGRIVLCARDNHRDVFLEIRRVVAEGAK
jgi:HEAT repeats